MGRWYIWGFSVLLLVLNETKLEQTGASNLSFKQNLVDGYAGKPIEPNLIYFVYIQWGDPVYCLLEMILSFVNSRHLNLEKDKKNLHFTMRQYAQKEIIQAWILVRQYYKHLRSMHNFSKDGTPKDKKQFT